MDTLSTPARTARVVAAGLGLALVLAGTLWGDDDDFPFGPFRMYSTAPGPDAPAQDTRTEGVDAAGHTVVLTEANSGVRRAEIEGQQQRYVEEPSLLRQVATAYAVHNPSAPRLVEVRIVIRWVGVRHSRPTGTSSDQTIATWVAP